MLVLTLLHLESFERFKEATSWDLKPERIFENTMGMWKCLCFPIETNLIEAYSLHDAYKFTSVNHQLGYRNVWETPS